MLDAISRYTGSSASPNSTQALPSVSLARISVTSLNAAVMHTQSRTDRYATERSLSSELRGRQWGCSAGQCEGDAVIAMGALVVREGYATPFTRH